MLMCLLNIKFAIHTLCFIHTSLDNISVSRLTFAYILFALLFAPLSLLTKIKQLIKLINLLTRATDSDNKELIKKFVKSIDTMQSH